MNNRKTLQICVCTRRRPAQLLELIESIPATIAHLAKSHPILAVGTTVVENDDLPRCGELLATTAARLGLDIQHVTEPRAGLSHARNRALEVCRSDFLLFVDDDEILAPDLLTELVSCQIEFDADLVAGIAPILYPTGTPQSHKGYFDPPIHSYGAKLECAATNCLLLRMDSLAKLSPPWFDLALNFSGGEDIDFTNRMVRSGARLVANPRAIAWDKLPPERTTLSYIFRRTYRNWMVGAELLLRTRRSTKAKLIALAGRRLLAGMALTPMRLVAGPKNRWEGALRIVQGIATLRGLTGAKSGFYKAS
ncbi:MAG: glycosyltransferase [Fibrobacteres bacterium]|nr:glycosyltransferase [Fibrobacterota bacterium]